MLGELDLALLGHELGIADRLARDPGWTWILERDGRAAGYLSFEIDREQHWAQCAAGGPVA